MARIQLIHANASAEVNLPQLGKLLESQTPLLRLAVMAAAPASLGTGLAGLQEAGCEAAYQKIQVRNRNAAWEAIEKRKEPAARRKPSQQQGVSSVGSLLGLHPSKTYPQCRRGRTPPSRWRRREGSVA